MHTEFLQSCLNSVPTIFLVLILDRVNLKKCLSIKVKFKPMLIILHKYKLIIINWSL